MHGFACQAIGAQGATAVEIGQGLGVSKQAAGKLVGTLEQAGYVTGEPDAGDGRRKLVGLTARGYDLLARSAQIFDDLRAEWTRELGEDRVRAMEDDLRGVTADASAPPARHPRLVRARLTESANGSQTI
jgi:DNA-binding MarR family transcriptional regulator